MAAVGVLVVIAIAGIVLASLRKGNAPTDAPAVSATTPSASAAMTAMNSAAASAASAEAEVGPNQVVFAADSDELSIPATTKLLRLAETAAKEKRTIVITGRFEARPDQAQRMALAQKRAFAVRSVFEESKIALGRMTVKVESKALGEVSPAELNRVEVELR